MKRASSAWSKATGLMFRARADYVLLFFLDGARHVITNLFVFQTIDLVFLDADRRVICLRQRFRPFTPCCLSPRGTAYMIEVPAGLDYQLAPGDRLEW